MIYFESSMTAAQAKRRHRELVRQHHPDLVGGDGETMKVINAQYDAWQKYGYVPASYAQQAQRTPEPQGDSAPPDWRSAWVSFWVARCAWMSWDDAWEAFWQNWYAMYPNWQPEPAPEPQPRRTRRTRSGPEPRYKQERMF